METPRLEIHIDRIAHNTPTVISQCDVQGIRVATVTKIMQTHSTLLRALERSGCVMLTDSQVDNPKQVAEAGLDLLTMLLQASTPGNAPEAVRWVDYTPISSYQTTEALSNATGTAGMHHEVVMMVDVGDLRESVWPDRAAEEISRITRLPHLEVAGLGINLARFGGVIPTRKRIRMLVTLKDECHSATGHPLELVFDGSNADLPPLAGGRMPTGINNLRVGEVIILGHNVLDRSPQSGTRQGTVELVGGIVESRRKPSVPIGRAGQDVLGNTTHFTDRGLRLRAICDLGRQDTTPDATEPMGPSIEMLGTNSNHLTIDVTDVETPMKVESETRSLPSYGGPLSASTSPHVRGMATGRS